MQKKQSYLSQWWGSEIPEPQYLSYDDLKEGKEGSMITLMLNRISIEVLCKQQRSDNPYHTSSFERVLTTFYEQFRMKPNYLEEGLESLLNGEVITPDPSCSNRMRHGKNGYPFEETQPE